MERGTSSIVSRFTDTTQSPNPHRRRAGHAFIERGWPVLPLVPGSSRPLGCPMCNSRSSQYVPHHGIEDCPHPADFCHGWKAATLDHDRLDRWLDRWPDANLGIATEPARLVIIDCDTAGGRHGQIEDPAYRGIEGVSDGLDVFALALMKYGRTWPETMIVGSPSGGLHLRWTLPEGVTIRSLNGAFGPLVDVKSKGAYIVAPTSAKPVGEYRRWRGIDEPAPAPAWLLHHLKLTGHYPPPPRPTGVYRRRDGDPGESLRALDAIADKLARAEAGTRHAQLCTATTAAAHLVADGRVAEDQALDAIRDAGYAADREGREIDDAWRTALAKAGGR